MGGSILAHIGGGVLGGGGGERGGGGGEGGDERPSNNQPHWPGRSSEGGSREAFPHDTTIGGVEGGTVRGGTAQGEGGYDGG